MDFGAKKNVSVSQLDNGNVFYFNLILIYQVKVWPERDRQLKKVNYTQLKSKIAEVQSLCTIDLS